MRVFFCFQLMQNVRFNWNVYNLKFNFLSLGQLVSWNLNTILPCYEVFFGNLFFAIITWMLCRNHFNFPII